MQILNVIALWPIFDKVVQNHTISCRFEAVICDKILTNEKLYSISNNPIVLEFNHDISEFAVSDLNISVHSCVDETNSVSYFVRLPSLTSVLPKRQQQQKTKQIMHASSLNVVNHFIYLERERNVDAHTPLSASGAGGEEVLKPSADLIHDRVGVVLLVWAIATFHREIYTFLELGLVKLTGFIVECKETFEQLLK